MPPTAPKPRPTRRRKRLLLGAVLVAAALIAAGYFIFNARKDPAPEARSSGEQPAAETTREDDTQVYMLATGDFIAHDAINAEAKTADGYDYSAMLAPFKDTFDFYDIKFCNQATLAGGDKFGITGYPVFNAPLQWIHALKQVGCNVINVGTNHTNDKGQGAITAMLDEWDQQDVLAVVGANRNTEEQNKVRYFESKGVKFALVSYSTYANLQNPNPYSLNRYAEPLVTTQMTEARSQADVVIVSMRWGTEYSETLNAAQLEQAQKLADLGADIVLGHGTHTLQPVKRLTGQGGRETIVWYGLGNFLNAQLETAGLTGCVATFRIDTATKRLTDSSCLPYYQHYEWTQEEKAREDLLARKHFRIMPLYKAAGEMSKSQIGTTVEDQMARIQGIVNTYTKISVQNAEDL